MLPSKFRAWKSMERRMGGHLVELCGGFMDRTYMFNQSTLVLEGITLAQMVKFVVEVFVDFAGSTVLDEEAAKDTETTHPHNLAVIQKLSASLVVFRARSPSHDSCCALFADDFGVIPRHPRIRCTLPLTKTPMSTNPSCGSQFSSSRS